MAVANIDLHESWDLYTTPITIVKTSASDERGLFDIIKKYFKNIFLRATIVHEDKVLEVYRQGDHIWAQYKLNFE